MPISLPAPCWQYDPAMSARYQIRHLTRYVYAHAAASGRHLAHLTPRATDWQRVESHTLRVAPPPTENDPPQTDYFGNTVRRWAIGAPHRELEVEAVSVVAIDSQAERWSAAGAWEDALVPRAADLVEFTLPSPYVPLIPAAADYARPSFSAARPLDEALHDVARRMRTDFVFDPAATTIATPIVDVLRRRRGVCQDFAHCLLSALRGLGFAARYMSGYVLDESGARGGAASHAWVAVHCPTVGWIGCDPTNGKLADLEFVTLGWGRDFGDVTPLRGIVLSHGAQQLSVSVEFRRL
jgi:transglutaminase-like putative cysteine protease